MKTEIARKNPVTIKSVAFDMLAIASLWSISLILIKPFGNFPLNDDWSFGLAVKQLIENGDFRPTGWTSMPLITQTIWGALFCIPTGFSFDALRLSTLFMSLTGILGVYFLMTELRQSRRLAVIASLTLGFSPIYFTLSNTFMTDVPYTAITILVAICFLRNLRNDSNSALILGTTLAVAATLTRQLGIALPMAFAISYIMRRGATARNLARAVIAPLLCIASLITFQYWLAATGRLPLLYHDFTRDLIHSFTTPETIVAFAENFYAALCYLGCFLLPVLVSVSGRTWAADKGKAKIFFIYAAGLMTSVFSVTALVSGRSHVILPVDSSFGIGNVIIKSGIGPITLPDTDYYSMQALPAGFWLAVTVLGFLGALVLIAIIWFNTIKSVPKCGSPRIHAVGATPVFLMLSAVIYLVPLLMTGFYDRYLVPVIPILAAGIAAASPQSPQKINKAFLVASAAVILALYSFSIVTTRDYLEWNRVRWDALHDLMKDNNVTAANIDGGFEFNGWYLYDPDYKGDPDKSWWWVQDDTYRLSFGRMPGYLLMGEYRYSLWLPPYAGSIVVQRRKNSGAPQT